MSPSSLPVPKPTDGGRPLTEAEKRRRRQRSIALALVLGALVIVFYIYTIARLGGNVLSPDDILG